MFLLAGAPLRPPTGAGPSVARPVKPENVSMPAPEKKHSCTAWHLSSRTAPHRFACATPCRPDGATPPNFGGVAPSLRHSGAHAKRVHPQPADENASKKNRGCPTPAHANKEIETTNDNETHKKDNRKLGAHRRHTTLPGPRGGEPSRARSRGRFRRRPGAPWGGCLRAPRAAGGTFLCFCYVLVFMYVHLLY